MYSLREVSNAERVHFSRTPRGSVLSMSLSPHCKCFRARSRLAWITSKSPLIFERMLNERMSFCASCGMGNVRFFEVAR